MLAEAKKGKRCPFRAVLVDDPSRLGRDLGITWRTIFEDLAAAGIALWDVSSGSSSQQPNARLLFGVQGLIADAYLETLRKQTHRGLESRALEGFSAGGRCFGYETYDEPNPADPERPRRLLRINETEARVVRRIFSEYASGSSLATIVDTLNSEVVAAPDDGHAKKHARGWSRSLLHAMLRNERYIGAGSSGTSASGSRTPSHGSAATASGRRTSGSSATSPPSRSSTRRPGRRCRPVCLATTRSAGKVAATRAACEP
jgi:DNA invertase Pin-like site-specific DNA recombinase